MGSGRKLIKHTWAAIAPSTRTWALQTPILVRRMFAASVLRVPEDMSGEYECVDLDDVDGRR